MTCKITKFPAGVLASLDSTFKKIAGELLLLQLFRLNHLDKWKHIGIPQEK